MIEKISELQNWAQENANKHHWVIQWDIRDSPPQETLSKIPVQCRVLSIGDALALIHSEVSEAFEEYEKGEYQSQEFAFELADIAIRILHMTGDLCYTALENDLAHRVGTQEKFLTQIQHLAYMATCAENDGINRQSVYYVMCKINQEISNALEAHRDNARAVFEWRIVNVMTWLLYFAENMSVNLTEAINAKMLKNQLRPINHGRINY